MLVSKLCACIPYIPIPVWHLFHPSFPVGLSGLSQQHHWVFLLLNDRDVWSVVICGFICAVESAGWTSWVFFIYLDVGILKGKEQWFHGCVWFGGSTVVEGTAPFRQDEFF